MRFFIFLLFISSVYSSTLRIATYNLLNFSDEDEREDDFRNIIEFINPDIIVVQEVVGQTGYVKFRSDVLDIVHPNTWEGAPFINQSAQQDIALFYKAENFSFQNTSEVPTAQSSGTRDVIEWVMVHNQSGIEFNLYGVHLKASSGDSNANQRLEEATVLRNYLNTFSENSYFIVAGDFNIYSNNSSSEPAFGMLTGETENNNGQLFDPINRIGHWHNNSSFADVHTQSPRTTNFGGGATGGMDDRFDWLFVSQNLLDNTSSMFYLEETYVAFGNDGNHFNDAINNGNNSSVPNDIADALHEASDHLPVYMDVWFDDLVYSDQGIMISEIMINPAAVSDSYGEWFEIVNTTDSIINIDGWSIKDSNGDMHTIGIENEIISIDAGQFFVLARNNNLSLNGGLNVDYVYENFSLSNSEDQIIIMDSSGAIIDEVYYEPSWPFSSGVSMEVQDANIDNSLISNWFSSTLIYGSGDYGTPGVPYDGTVDINLFDNLPSRFYVAEPFPNPFNPQVSIEIQNSSDVYCIIEVFDLSGKRLQTLNNSKIIAGNNQFDWNADEYSSGMYFFKISIQNNHWLKKAILLK